MCCFGDMQAARDGREDLVRAWLQKTTMGKRGSINDVDVAGFAAMHYAAKFNRFKIMQLLATASGIG